MKIVIDGEGKILYKGPRFEKFVQNNPGSHLIDSELPDDREKRWNFDNNVWHFPPEYLTKKKISQNRDKAIALLNECQDKCQEYMELVALGENPPFTEDMYLQHLEYRKKLRTIRDGQQENVVWPSKP